MQSSLPPAIQPLVGHVDDPVSRQTVLHTLSQLHGSSYSFNVRTWEGLTTLTLRKPTVLHLFVMKADNASVALQPGDQVRGAPSEGPFDPVAADTVVVKEAISMPLWPGDVVCLDAREERNLLLIGAGTAFAVSTEPTDYRPPRLALLRYLPDHPGGCAQYEGAFRREALPPLRPPQGAEDQRGVNRVNEHTLDMRIDRTPGPMRHHHGPVPIGGGRMANHSETALVLPRSVYGLPEVDQPDQGHVILHPRPLEAPQETVRVPVQPGAMLITPASTEQVMGHRFENCFAMLVAIPGFVAPYHLLPEPKMTNLGKTAA